MATIPPGTQVRLAANERSRLFYPPPRDAALHVAVHRDALKGGATSPLTQLVGAAAGSLVWVGALDERMLEVTDGAPMEEARRLIAASLFGGGRDEWTVIRPGLLTTTGTRRPHLTLYDGDRPWVVLGRLPTGGHLAAPLNDARGNPKWWAPRIDRRDLLIPSSKEGQLELAHLWSFEGDHPRDGTVALPARPAIEAQVRRYVT